MVGLKDTKTGLTLCDLKDQIILESMEFPDPVISVAVEPASKQDQENLTVALSKLAEEDPTFNVKSDEDSGETIISVDKQYTRPSETDHLLGDASKAKKTLGWKPSINFKSLVNMMVEHDLKRMKDNNFWF